MKIDSNPMTPEQAKAAPREEKPLDIREPEAPFLMIYGSYFVVLLLAALIGAVLFFLL